MKGYLSRSGLACGILALTLASTALAVEPCQTDAETAL